MPYQRPRNLHETPYTNGEKVFSLQHQLVLLRESLVRTVIDPTFYPDLFRALRVLIIDGNRGRLGEMAARVGERYLVLTRPIAKVEPREGVSENTNQGYIVFPRQGLDNLLLPNLHSRWFAIRGIHPNTDSQPTHIDFWDYLEKDVIAFKKEYGAEITREALIREICDTKDVAHSANCYPTFLRFTNALSMTDPYFLEIAQEVAYEILTFGRKVVSKCSEKFQDQISMALPYVLPTPQIQCSTCHNVLAVDELACSHCGSGLIPPQRYGPREQLTSMLLFGGCLEMPTGSVSPRIDMMTLAYEGVVEYSLVELRNDKSQMLLKRTGDRKLIWRVERDLLSHSASWDLDEMPQAKSVVLILTWSPDGVSIISNCRRGGLWQASSDGSFRKLEEQPNPKS
ncbi:MAG: hypothetical protein HZB51_32555 [Chloroflexi bacterium]|nr:hypothetical protein [Chloroflexota bacterium]